MATSTVHTIETFVATLGSGMKDGTFIGTYDPESGVVHIEFCCRKDTDIGTGTTLFTIPERYRPAANKNIPSAIFLSNGGTMAYRSTVSTSGAVTQGGSNSARGVFGSGAYKI